MPIITFIEHSGVEHRVDVEVGISLMSAARANGVPGILGDCGGCCSCATCHCYLEDSAGVAPATDDERLMLDGALDTRDESRLACQIIVSQALDGRVVRLPESQM